MTTAGKMQAKDIPDIALLIAINNLQQIPQIYFDRWARNGEMKIDYKRHWIHRNSLEDAWSEVPAKVIRAKCARLIKRGLLEGCTCGCRGDFELTAKGLQALAAG